MDIIGHQGCDATRSIILESFWWSTVEKDVEQLIRGCFHCVVTRTGQGVPQPLGSAIHGERPNEVLHMDFLFLGAGNGGQKYVLILKDDFSHYVWLWNKADVTAVSAAETLCVWMGVFGAMAWPISDQGSHFKNTLIRELTDDVRTRHHSTTEYSPWAYESVERDCREVLRSCKALISEWKLSPKDWPTVTEAVQSVLNHAPKRTLGLRKKSVTGVYRTL